MKIQGHIIAKIILIAVLSLTFGIMGVLLKNIPEANVVKLLKDRGIDVSAHLAAQITANDVRHADVLLTMTDKHKTRLVDAYPEAKAKTFTLAEYATGTTADVPDAWGKPMEVYVAMIAQLDSYLPAVLKKSLTIPAK